MIALTTEELWFSFCLLLLVYLNEVKPTLNSVQTHLSKTQIPLETVNYLTACFATESRLTHTHSDPLFRASVD